MKVLIVGGGGREHALAWKLAQSPLVSAILAAPGNPGIETLGTCFPISAEDTEGLKRLALNEKVGCVIIGPEAPLAAGLTDMLEAEGMCVFGPSRAAARLETSKAFAKDFCVRHGIPTARHEVFESFETAQKALSHFSPPYVIKADGLAAGKGVVLCENKAIAEHELKAFFEGKFGPSGQRVVLEDYLEGEEVSVFALCDGKRAVILRAAQDHKRAFDGDNGPNTGGMGAYSPTPVLDHQALKQVEEAIIKPTLAGMSAEGMPYKGVLYAGLMMTEQGPKLIEFNVRFGDPECQTLMVRLKNDLFPVLHACAQGDLSQIPYPEWHDDRAVTLVLAAKGYPESYEKGSVITGLQKAESFRGVMVFHAGTARDDRGQLISAGGRVLNVTALGDTLRHAVERAYEAAEVITWPEGFYRKDIAWKALALQP